MFNILLWQMMRRILACVLLALFAAFTLPHALTERLWVGALCGLAVPLLILGRRRSLNRRTYAQILGNLPHRRWWQVWGLTPIFFMIALWSIVIARGSPKLSFTFFMWGVCCASIADLFDQREARLGEAWGYSTLLIGVLVSSPFWGALWFGRTAFSPWVATLSLSIHPTFAGLKSTGAVTLQDPLLYELTQSGFVEVHPLPWWIASCVYLVLSLICLEIAARTPLNRGE